MKTLRTAYFTPLEGLITLYTSENGYAQSQPQPVTSLPSAMQTIVDGAVAWLAAQLPTGMQTVSQIILTRNADVPVTWSEAIPPAPLTWSAAFEISATGTSPAGEATITIKSIPGEVTTAVAALWDYLATQL